jgi:hypothetical protein
MHKKINEEHEFVHYDIYPPEMKYFTASLLCAFKQNRIKEPTRTD